MTDKPTKPMDVTAMVYRPPDTAIVKLPRASLREVPLRPTTDTSAAEMGWPVNPSTTRPEIVC